MCLEAERQINNALPFDFELSVMTVMVDELSLDSRVV